VTIPAHQITTGGKAERAGEPGELAQRAGGTPAGGYKKTRSHGHDCAKWATIFQAARSPWSEVMVYNVRC